MKNKLFRAAASALLMLLLVVTLLPVQAHAAGATLTGTAAPQAGAKALTTPERLDRQRAHMVERLAAFDRRAAATRTFYAQLTPAQQKTFDDQGARMVGQRGAKQGWGMHRHGHHHGFGPGASMGQ